MGKKGFDRGAQGERVKAKTCMGKDVTKLAKEGGFGNARNLGPGVEGGVETTQIARWAGEPK